MPEAMQPLERWLERLLRYGTLLACAIIAAGLILNVSDNPMTTAGIALMILLPTVRVVVMFFAFLRARNWLLAITAAVVLAILSLGFLIGIRTNTNAL